MDCRQLPDVELLRKLLDYDPESGELTWRERDCSVFNDTPGRSAKHSCRLWNDRNAGKPALHSIDNCGYRRGSLLGRKMLSHRAAWAIFYGQWPENYIDHINGNRADNRIQNLRDVTRAENQKNQRMNCLNTSGALGVCLFKPTGKWSAEIKVGGEKFHLGYFSCKEDAIAARKAAECRYGFHPNHGRSS